MCPTSSLAACGAAADEQAAARSGDKRSKSKGEKNQGVGIQVYSLTCNKFCLINCTLLPRP